MRALEQGGFDVSWQRVQAEGDLKQALQSSRPQAVLSDFSMPGFDGIQALRVVREMSPGVPFIFVSGTIGEERAIEAIRFGATDYVLKNNLQRLGTAVRRALSESAERERIRVTEEERGRLVQILEATSDYVGMSDPDGRIIYLNAAGRKLIGAPKSGGIDKQIDGIYPQWARDLIGQEGRPTAARDGVWHGETAILDADGAEIPVSEVTIAHNGPDGAIRFFSTIARDMRERKAYEARLQRYANYDSLTNLPNRTLLGDRTLQAIAHARRGGRPAALLVLNLDRFKLVNESYGHGAGDALLKMVADRLRGVVREGDTVARLGADTFAVLATDLARPDDVLAVVRKIQEAMRPSFGLEKRDLHMTVSLGASTYPRDGEEFDILVRNAEAAMHRVKAAGRNGFQFYAAAMTRQATDRVELENELRLALGRNELEVHYQPQLALSDGRIVGVEALIRWQHRERGWIPPVQFIPVAEDCDLIHPLGEFALVEGCRQVGVWDKAGLAELRLAVNVSAQQFRSSGFVETVTRALRATDLEPYRLDARRQSRGGDPHPEALEGPRCADRGGRLRNGLLELELSFPVADRLPQDRPLLRQSGSRARPRCGDCAGGHLPGALTRHACRRRRYRDGRATWVPAHSRVRRGAGVSPFASRASRCDRTACRFTATVATRHVYGSTPEWSEALNGITTPITRRYPHRPGARRVQVPVGPFS